MATAGIFNGDLLLLDADGNPIAHSTDATLSVTKDAPETTTKDSAGFKEHLIDGNRSWEMSVSGLVTFDAANNSPEDLLDSWLNNTSIAMKFTTTVVGDTEYTGNVTLTAWSENAPQNAPVSFECTFTGNGALAKATIV